MHRQFEIKERFAKDFYRVHFVSCIQWKRIEMDETKGVESGGRGWCRLVKKEEEEFSRFVLLYGRRRAKKPMPTVNKWSAVSVNYRP